MWKYYKTENVCLKTLDSRLEMDSWLIADTLTPHNLSVRQNLLFLSLPKMVICKGNGKYGNVLIGQFLTYRQVMGSKKVWEFYQEFISEVCTLQTIIFVFVIFSYVFPLLVETLRRDARFQVSGFSFDFLDMVQPPDKHINWQRKWQIWQCINWAIFDIQAQNGSVCKSRLS